MPLPVAGAALPSPASTWLTLPLNVTVTVPSAFGVIEVSDTSGLWAAVPVLTSPGVIDAPVSGRAVDEAS